MEKRLNLQIQINTMTHSYDGPFNILQKKHFLFSYLKLTKNILYLGGNYNLRSLSDVSKKRDKMKSTNFGNVI
jgi:hypothetical protein